jgi:hypothetical protein
LQQIGIPYHDPLSIRLLPKDGQRAARTNGRIPTCQWDNANSEVAPAVRQGSARRDFLDFSCRFDAALGQKTAKRALEGGAASHWRVTGDKEDNVFGHETQHGVDITLQPLRYAKARRHREWLARQS